VTVTVPVFDGAVKTPADVMLPAEAVQVTALLVVVPWTVAVKGKVPVVIERAVTGDTDTEVTDGVGAGLVGVGLVTVLPRSGTITSPWFPPSAMES
jgi:hypothetical protein